MEARLKPASRKFTVLVIQQDLMPTTLLIRAQLNDGIDPSLDILLRVFEFECARELSERGSPASREYVHTLAEFGVPISSDYLHEIAWHWQSNTMPSYFIRPLTSLRELSTVQCVPS